MRSLDSAHLHRTIVPILAKRKPHTTGVVWGSIVRPAGDGQSVRPPVLGPPPVRPSWTMIRNFELRQNCSGAEICRLEVPVILPWSFRGVARYSRSWRDAMRYSPAASG